MQTIFDPTWQNPDGTLKALTRAELRTLSPDQRRERVLAQGREYTARCRLRCLGLQGVDLENALAALRARRARRLVLLREQSIAAQEASKRLERARAHPAYPARPGATVDEEIRTRLQCSNDHGRRPACGVF